MNTLNPNHEAAKQLPSTDLFLPSLVISLVISNLMLITPKAFLTADMAFSVWGFQLGFSFIVSNFPLKSPISSVIMQIVCRL